MSALAEFCFAQEDVFLVPAEELSAAGMSKAFAALLCERRRVSPEWIERFERAFGLYWERALELAARAPRYWLPPRVPNVCVALDPIRVRPFFQPLGRSSWLVEVADFEPRSSSLEYSTYQFFYVERTGLLGQITPALAHDLSYWLLRTREELLDFGAGCRRARGGEAQGYRALAQALDWIPRAWHETLKPRPTGAREPHFPVEGTGTMVPERFRRDLDGLARRWTEAAEKRVSAYYAVHSGTTKNEAALLGQWIASERPLVLVTGGKGEIFWDPAVPEQTERLCAELAGVTATAAASLRADWSVVGARSKSFLDSLVRPEDLPGPGAQIDQDGLSYVHRERKLVAYNVRERAMQRLREPAPPFERWMLGARTIHEWGHLAVDAGWIPVPGSRRIEFQSVQAELAELFTAIVAGAPAILRAHAKAQLAALEKRAGSIGRGLLAIPLERMSDWQSNLLAQRYLPREESETYVRSNIRTLLRELDSDQLFQALARYAFEYQYLAFSAVTDPRGYFLASTWFGEQFLARGVLSEAELDGLFALVGRLCACHEIDTTRFKDKAPPSTGSVEGGAPR